MKVEGETIGRCKECGCCCASSFISPLVSWLQPTDHHPTARCYSLTALADKLAYHNPWAAVIPEIAEATKDSKVVSTHDAHH